MINAYKNFWKNTFNYTGVSSRKDYWLATIATFIFALVFVLGLFILAPMLNSEVVAIFCILSLIIICVVSVLPSISIQVRRLRDAGFHWAFMLLYLLPYIGSLVLLVLYCMPTKYVVRD